MFYWANLKADDCKYVKKMYNLSTMQGRDWLTTAMERIGIALTDIVVDSQGYRYAFPVVDHYSSFVRFLHLKTKHFTHTSYTLCGNMLLTTGQHGAQFWTTEESSLARSFNSFVTNNTSLCSTRFHTTPGQQNYGADASNPQVLSGSPLPGPTAPLALSTPTSSDHDE